MNELDEILLDQYHTAKRRKKIYKRMKKLMPTERLLIVGNEMNDKYINFFESMISDNQLLINKHKKKKCKDSDILARNPVYEWYRQALYITVFSYKTFVDSAVQYMNWFKKKE